MKTSSGVLVVIVVAGFCAPLRPADQAAPKARPIPTVQGSFQLVPGTWAVYDIHQVADKTDSRLYFALDQRVKQGNVPAMWIEVEVTQAEQPGVVTRFLAEETAEGPGKLLDCIVQVKGYDPFRIPKSYLKEGKDEAPKFQTLTLPAVTAGKVPSKTALTVNGRRLQVYAVDGKDEQGRPIRAVVTEEVPPLALVSVTTPDVTMQLVDWGSGVQSRIKGKPSSLWWWITKQIGKALSAGDSTTPAKP
jgi:hypothetical protein